nr:hypothetical protein [Tanacetum cinerariifolium]
MEKTHDWWCGCCYAGSVQAGFFSDALSISSDILCRVIKVANAGIIFSEDVAHMAVGLLIDVLTQDVPLSMIRKHLRMKADFAT